MFRAKHPEGGSAHGAEETGDGRPIHPEKTGGEQHADGDIEDRKFTVYFLKLAVVLLKGALDLPESVADPLEVALNLLEVARDLFEAAMDLFKPAVYLVKAASDELVAIATDALVGIEPSGYGADFASLAGFGDAASHGCIITQKTPCGKGAPEGYCPMFRANRRSPNIKNGRQMAVLGVGGVAEGGHVSRETIGYLTN